MENCDPEVLYYRDNVQNLLNQNPAVGQPQLYDLCKLAKTVDYKGNEIDGVYIVQLFVEHMQKYYGDGGT